MNDTEQTAEKPAEKSRRKMIRVRATHDGYRRAGRAWPRTPTELPADEFTKEQLEVLKADPRITVE